MKVHRTRRISTTTQLGANFSMQILNSDTHPAKRRKPGESTNMTQSSLWTVLEARCSTKTLEKWFVRGGKGLLNSAPAGIRIESSGSNAARASSVSRSPVQMIGLPGTSSVAQQLLHHTQAALWLSSHSITHRLLCGSAATPSHIQDTCQPTQHSHKLDD